MSRHSARHLSYQYRLTSQTVLALVNLKSNLKSSEQIKYNLVTNYLKPQELLSVEQAVFYQDFALRTPMGSNACAFSSKAEAIQFKESKEGKIIDWQSL
jgi:hypothetical protein